MPNITMIRSTAISMMKSVIDMSGSSQKMMIDTNMTDNSTNTRIVRLVLHRRHSKFPASYQHSLRGVCWSQSHREHRRES